LKASAAAPARRAAISCRKLSLTPLLFWRDAALFPEGFGRSVARHGVCDGCAEAESAAGGECGVSADGGADGVSTDGQVNAQWKRHSEDPVLAYSFIVACSTWSGVRRIRYWTNRRTRCWHNDKRGQSVFSNRDTR